MGCPYCQRAFMYRSDLSRHVRTHTGERPYFCPHCPYRASQKSHLLEHVKRRHRVSVGPSSTTITVPSTASPGTLVVPSGTLVVPASSLVVSGTGLTSSMGTSSASVHHTILHTPSHITTTTASSAVTVCPSTLSLQQLQVSSAATSSHGVLYNAPHSSSSSQQLLYSPSNSPQQAVLHTPQHVTVSPSFSGQQLLSVSSSSALQPLIASNVTSDDGSNSSSSALQLHISPSICSSGGVQLINAHASSAGGVGHHHVNHVPATSTGPSQHPTSCCSGLHHHHSQSLVLSPLHTPTYSGHHTSSLPAHSTP